MPFPIRRTCLLQLFMVRLCPMPHTPERYAQALAQRCQRILDPRRNNWIHGSRHETITLHLSQSLGQHLLADSIHQLRQATEPNYSMLCQSLQQKQGPLVRNAADNLFHQTNEAMAANCPHSSWHTCRRRSRS
jgi:hypothetical protein